MLTWLSPEALSNPSAVTELNKKVEDRVRKDLPQIKWLANYAMMGPCDYLDIFEAPDMETAQKVSLLVRSFGHASTQTWVANPWDRFVQMVEELR
jgi:uncharacterized protein with GYD domain